LLSARVNRPEPTEPDPAVDAELGRGTLGSLDLDHSATVRAETDRIGALAFAEESRIAFGTGSG